MLLWNNFKLHLCQCKLSVFRSNLTCIFNSDKQGKQESVLLGESFTHNALVSFYVIILHCKCYFIVCQICHSQVFLLSEWRLAPQKNWSVCMAHRRLLEWMSLHSQRKLFKNSRVQLQVSAMGWCSTTYTVYRQAFSMLWIPKGQNLVSPF